MNFEQSSIIVILSLLLAGFIWGKWRYDIVALTALFVCAILGVIQPQEVFSGFSHPATITVAFVLILSHGLMRSNAVSQLLKVIEPLADRPVIYNAILIFLAAVLSMFMNNVGALALLMPAAIHACTLAERSPATVLMPLSFAAILGGMVTLIGTPPNIIVSTFRAQSLGVPYQMFDFSPVGLIVASIGILFLATVGWSILSHRKERVKKHLFEIEAYLFELKIDKTSSLIDRSFRKIEPELTDIDVVIVSVTHKNSTFKVLPRNYKFSAGDLLLVEGSHPEMNKFMTQFKLILLSAEDSRKAVAHQATTETLEAVVGPQSMLENKTVEQIKFRINHQLNLLAVFSGGLQHQGRLRTFKFSVGDVLLLHGNIDSLEEGALKLGCLPLAHRFLNFGKPRLAIATLSIFCIAIALATFGLLPIYISLGLAAVVMVLLGILPTKEFYAGIDWSVVFLLAAMIPIGTALESTGVTQLLVDYLLKVTAGMPAYVLLVLLLVVTMTLSDLLNNAATAILMAPIALHMAGVLSKNPDPFLMAVAVGASCAFLTPIGHQNNALVMGPGGYKFGDYWKLGLPLEIAIVLVSVPAILFFWPL